MNGVIRELLNAYPGLSGPADVVPVAGGFSGARVFKISSVAGNYCVRQWPSVGLPLERIAELHRWLGDLSVHELPVTVPLRHRDGGTVLPYRGRFWQVEQWVAGRSLEQEAASEARIRNAMTMLARLHLISERYIATPTGRTWFAVARQAIPPAILERRRRTAELTVERLRDLKRSRPRSADFMALHALAHEALDEAIRLRASIVGELARCENLRSAVFPCWRDLWKAHVLFSGDSVTGLIDASAARMDHPATDVARLLGSLGGDLPVSWEEALASYGEVRTIRDEDRRLVRVLDRSGTWLGAMNWVEQLRSQGIPPDALDRVRVRLGQLVERLRSL